MPLEKKRGNESVQMADIFLRKRDSLSGFGKGSLIFFLCQYRIIKAFLKGAFISVRATVAYIRWLCKLRAVFLAEIRAYFIALLA